MSDRAGVEKVFRETLAQFGRRYGERTFYAERDVVYLLQTELVSVLRRTHPEMRVFNDHKVFEKARADLLITTPDDERPAVLAVEFKYEPDRRRTDIPQGKFPVTAWAEILRDVQRVHRLVNDGWSTTAYAVLLDEDGRYDARADVTFEEPLRWNHGEEPGERATCWLARSGPPVQEPAAPPHT